MRRRQTQKRPAARLRNFTLEFAFPTKGEDRPEERFCFRPLRRSEVRQAVAFLKHNFPDLRGSFYRQYLEPRFYYANVAFLEGWKRQRKTRDYYVAVLEHLESGRICALGGGGREADLPFITTHVGTIAARYRDSGLFEYFLTLCEEAMERLGFDHILCIASGCTPAAQQAYLNMGMKVCGIIPGGDLFAVKRRGKTRRCYVPDIYFFKSLKRGRKRQLPPGEWQLVPRVKALWKAILKTQRLT